MDNAITHTDVSRISRRIVARCAGAIGLLGVAAVHVLDLLQSQPAALYVNATYVALIAGTVGCAAELVRSGDRRAWLAGALLADAALVGFAVDGGAGLLQPLGLVSLFAAIGVLGLGSHAFAAPAGRATLRYRHAA